MGSYHTLSGMFDPNAFPLSAKKAQQEMDVMAGNCAIKWREEQAKSCADWDLPPDGEQQNSAEGK